MPACFDNARKFLAEAHLAGILELKPPVTTINKWTKLPAATQILESNKVLSLPVLDEEAEYAGCLSVNDILRFIFKGVQDEDPEWTEHLDTFTAEKLAEIGATFDAQTVDKLQHDADLWLLSADSKSSVLDAVRESFHVLDAHVHHRLFICTPAREQPTSVNAQTTVINIRPGSERVAASGWRVSGVVSHTDVVKLLAENKQVLGEGAFKTVEELELDAGAALTVPADMPALEAFGFMFRDRKSSMGLVDQAGRLVGNLSVSALRGLTGAEFPLLQRSAAEFALLSHGKAGFTKAEALAGQHVADPLATLAADMPVVTVTPASKFADVLDALVTNHVHRAYVVDEERLVSIITLTDVLRVVSAPPVVRPPPRVVAASATATEEEETGDDE